ncbi:MAG: DNA polymerase III subunit delta [bacterium]|nr:DNA polymerase III subunit delta [bacterium]
MMANWGGRSEGPDFASLRRELAAGSFRPVYLLAGEDTHRASSIVEYLVNKLLGASGSAFNSHVFDGEQAGCDKILQQARSYPMFGDRQVIWVKRAEHMVGDAASEQALQRYLADPVAATTLILMSEKVDGRKSWVKACKTAGCFFEMAPPSGRDLVDWTVRRAKDKKLPLALELAEMLVELVGDDLHALDGELDKLALIAAEAKDGLDEEALRAVILEQRAIDPFELVKQLGPGTRTRRPGGLPALPVGRPLGLRAGAAAGLAGQAGGAGGGAARRRAAGEGGAGPAGHHAVRRPAIARDGALVGRRHGGAGPAGLPPLRGGHEEQSLGARDDPREGHPGDLRPLIRIGINLT